MMKRNYVWIVTLALAGCATTPKPDNTLERINAEMDKAAEHKAVAAQPDAVSNALLPPLKIELPKSAAKPLEPRFDLVVNNAPANQVFMGIVSGTRYSMLVHPEVSGSLSANLKDVTVLEALDSIRELYGYDYKIEGSRIFVQPLTMQTRFYQVNYPTSARKGTSELRVISGSVSDSGHGSSSSSSGTSSSSSSSGSSSSSLESSRIATTSNVDFWSELAGTVATLVGCKTTTQPATDKQAAQVTVACEGGRNIVVSPTSGMIAVRAMPVEQRIVADYLKAAQLAVERQVMLEAKIIEVQLNDSFQSGINWAAFKTGPNSNVSLGQLVPGVTLANSGNLVGATTQLPDGTVIGTPVSATPGSVLQSATNAAGSLFGLAFQTSNFAALLSFLETQGNVHVLSSPRISTLNNQKAVLKVGTDEFFVTEVSTNSTTSGTSTTTTPTVTVQPFFSGIALDVTPQIDEHDNIILHIHPSVSQVSTVNKEIRLGSSIGTFTLPLASSTVSETDSVVRARDQQIVAIGGLMKQTQNDDHSQVPGLGDMPGIGHLFRQTNQASMKRELVILLKPTVIQSDGWSQDIQDSRERIRALERRQPQTQSQQ